MATPDPARWRLTESGRRRARLWITGLASAGQLGAALLLRRAGSAQIWEPLLGGVLCAVACALVASSRIPWRWVDIGLLVAATLSVGGQLLTHDTGAPLPPSVQFAGVFLFLTGFIVLPVGWGALYAGGVLAVYSAVLLRSGDLTALWQLGLAGLLSAYLSAFGRTISAERAEAEAFERLALTDPLTGLDNCRAMMARLQKAAHTGQPVTALLLDIDRFKGINDRLGHDVGDEVLREVGRRLRAAVGTHGAVARWGGEEFLVLLDGAASAQATGQALRQAVRAAPMAGGVTVTVSLGGAALREVGTVGELLKLADARLYVAKSSGRDRAELSVPQLHEVQIQTLA
ncbi:GGDEF domain-containing protein [Deinococcus sp. HMF7604]|uniref:GGDEF domain-containing protein n=1 Tax=Deinococcus betulae TaxID=2873312 RepID=UPI001CCF2457|nr:GGDEF domain-containing protein [Deinococcus betulae]MBZ9750091.1 GGDEF domain-containing protein [Deinococcus betulae]